MKRALKCESHQHKLLTQSVTRNLEVLFKIERRRTPGITRRPKRLKIFESRRHFNAQQIIGSRLTPSITRRGGSSPRL
jgi:hypothetical protein